MSFLLAFVSSKGSCHLKADIVVVVDESGSVGNGNFELTKNILSAWSHSAHKLSIGYFQWFKVIYNKNDVVSDNPLTQWDDDIHIYQKPREHIMHSAKRIKQTPIEQLDGPLTTR